MRAHDSSRVAIGASCSPGGVVQRIAGPLRLVLIKGTTNCQIFLVDFRRPAWVE
jgi:hypothetical protein